MKNLRIRRISLIIMLLSFFIYSQNTFAQEDDKKVRVKIVKYKNGKKVTIDTVISEGFVFDKTKILDNVDFDFDFKFDKDSMFSIHSINLDNLGKKIGDLKSYKSFFNDSLICTSLDSMKAKLKHLNIDLKNLDKIKTLSTFKFNDSDIHIKLDSINEHIKFDLKDLDKLKNLNPLKHGNIIITSDDDEKVYVYKSLKGNKGMKVIIKDDGKNKKINMFTISGEDIIIDGDTEGTITIICDKMVFSDLDKEDIEGLKDKGISVESGNNELDAGNFVCYPNPTLGKLKIRFELQDKEKTMIRIFDMNEKVVHKEKLNNFSGKYEKEIDLSGNKPGVYFIKVTQGNKMIVKKIILK